MTQCVPDSARLVLRLLIAVMAIGSRLPAQSCATTAVSTSCNVTTTVSLPVPYIAQLGASSTETALTIAPSNLGGFNGATGSNKAIGPQITARANAAYAVSIGAGAATWSYTGFAVNPMKPASDLGYQTSTTGAFQNPGTFTTIATDGASLLTGTAGTASSVFLRWQTAWSWATSKPGTYSLPITFTLTVP